MPLAAGMATEVFITDKTMYASAELAGSVIDIVYDYKVLEELPGGARVVELTENPSTVLPAMFVATGIVKYCKDETPPALVGKYRIEFKEGCDTIDIVPVEDACAFRKQTFEVNGRNVPRVPVDVPLPADAAGNTTVKQPEYRCEPLDLGNPIVKEMCGGLFPEGYHHVVPFGSNRLELENHLFQQTAILNSGRDVGGLSDGATKGLGRPCIAAWLKDVCLSTFASCDPNADPPVPIEQTGMACRSVCDDFLSDCVESANSWKDVSFSDLFAMQRARLDRSRLEAGDLLPVEQLCSGYSTNMRTSYSTNKTDVYSRNASTCVTRDDYTYDGTVDMNSTFCLKTEWFEEAPSKDLGLSANRQWTVNQDCTLPCPFWYFGYPKSEEDSKRDTAKTVAVVCSILGLIGAGLVLFTFAMFRKQKMKHPKANVAYMLICAVMYMLFGPFLTWLQGWEDVTCRNEFYENTQADGGYCFISGIVCYYFGQARVFWWTMHAIDFFLTEFNYKKIVNHKHAEKLHHIIGWGAPLAWTIAAIHKEKYGFSEGGNMLWCQFAAKSMKTYVSKSDGVSLNSFGAQSQDDFKSQDQAFCTAYSSAERWTGLIAFKYGWSMPCTAIGGILTMCVLYKTLKDTYYVSVEEANRAAAKMAAANISGGESGDMKRSESSDSLAKSPSDVSLRKNESSDSLAKSGSDQSLSEHTGENSKRRMSSFSFRRRMSLGGDEFDLLGARRFSRRRFLAQELWKRRENYWSKFAFIMTMWLSQIVDIAFQLSEDIFMKEACNTITGEVVMAQLLPVYNSKSSVDINTNVNLFYFKIALVAGVGIHMFITGGLTSENFTLWRRKLKEWFPSTKEEAKKATAEAPAPLEVVSVKDVAAEASQAAQQQQGVAESVVVAVAPKATPSASS